MKPADKPKKAAPAGAKPRPGKPASGGGAGFKAILFNLAGAAAAGLLIMFLFQHHEPTSPTDTYVNSGYDWLLNTMLENNLKTIEQYPDKTLQERYVLKWGPGEILYIDSVRKLTPENAIVMIPPHTVLSQVGFKSCGDLPWVTYFLYPRQVVYGDSVNSPLYAKADYVMSVNGWGLDKSPTPVTAPQPFMVLPLKK
ncbi:MAG: hypothetical protein JST76_09695 [Bacteroidetes bacterium]|nr:hypothetical protein [Bacteroidota bacterium]